MKVIKHKIFEVHLMQQAPIVASRVSEFYLSVCVLTYVDDMIIITKVFAIIIISSMKVHTDR